MRIVDLLTFLLLRKKVISCQMVLAVLLLALLPLTSSASNEAPPKHETDALMLVIECPFTMVLQCDESTDPSNTGTATASGNTGCGLPGILIEFSDVSTQGPAFCPQYSYFISRTWTATDPCGNSASCIQLIQVLDDTPPAISCPADTNMECNDNPNPAINTALGMATSPGDNCSAANEININFVDATDQGATGCNAFNYTITRTWMATDACGNMSTCTQMISVSDNTPPLITCPATVNVSCEGSTDPSATGTPAVTDNCDPFVVPTFTDAIIAGTGCSQNYSIERTWTAIDDCGNESTCVQMIHVTDTTAPALVCPSGSFAVLSCGDPLPPAATSVAELIALGGSVSDNCSANDEMILLSTISNNAGSFCPGDAYSVVRTYTLIDACGNASSCEQIFLYAESFNGPVITNVAATCTKYCANMINPDPSDITFTTDCNLGATVSISGPVIAGIPDCPNTSYDYTYTVTDACGRSTSAQRTFLIGNDGPVIECPPFNLILDCGNPNNDAYIATHLSQVTAYSSCDLGLTISNNYSPQTGVLCGSPNVVTITATDACGRSVSCETTITLLDNTSPVITQVPPSVCDETECNDDTDYWFNHWIEYMEAGLEATDECGQVSWSTIPAVPVINEDCDASGTAETVVTWVATDQCGNTSTVTENFVVNNEYPATLESVPADETISCDETPVFGPDPTIVHGCQTSLSFVDATDDSDPCAILMTRTWTATDACGGLTTSATQTITLVDDSAPVINGGADLTVECDGNGNNNELINWLNNNAGATATDDCNGVNWTNDYDPAHWMDNADCAGGIAAYVDVTFTATDNCSNADEVTYRFNIEDTTAPQFAFVPAGGTVECVEDAVFEMATANDVCSTPMITSTDATTGDDCSGTVTRTWTATDACGNATTASATIQYSDTAAPVADNVPADYSISCEQVPVFGDDLNWTDNCDEDIQVTVTDSTIPGACANEYMAVRTWTAEDDCGNTAAVTQTISVVDDAAPVFTYVPFDGSVDCIDFVMFENATAVDNCGTAVITFLDTNTGDNCAGSITRVWTATDACGNTATASATISYEDNVAPIFTFVPANSFVECSADAIFEVAVAADLCSTVTLTTSDVTTGDNCVGSMTRTWTASDVCGNTATASTTIEYADFVPPVVSEVPPSKTISCDEPMVFGPEPIFTDNCDSDVTVTFQDIETPGDCLNGGFLYTMERIWTGTDDCGFFATANQTITVIDETAPVWTYVPETKDVDCDEDLDFELPVAEDDCGAVVITWEEDINGELCDAGYAKVRVWTATDACGNSSTVETTVWVNPDNEGPEFTFVPDGALITCAEFPPIFGEPVVEDNCGTVTLTFIDEAIGNPNGCAEGEDFDYRRVWTATDDCGNTSTAKQTFWVKYEAPPGATLLGMIANEDNEAVESVMVQLDGAGAGMSDSYQTTEDGLYSFSGLPLNNNYSISPELNENPLNGVSSFDLILIAKHLVGIQALDSPYKQIAADVNQSGSISTLDLLELRKLILFVDTEFQYSNSWRFVLADYVFPDATNPFSNSFPEVVNINGLQGDEQHDFIGIKVGDVNGNAVANNLLGGDGRDFDGELVFEIKDQKLEAGEVCEVVFKAQDFIEVMGYQFTLNFDSEKLDFESIGALDLEGLTTANFGLSLLSQGALTTSWTQNDALTLVDGATLFSLRFVVKADGYLSDCLQVSSRFTTAESYVKQQGVAGVGLNDIAFRFDDVEVAEHRFRLYQNKPNPFSEETIISFNLPEASTAVLTIYDVNGTVVKIVEGEYGKGYNEVQINLKEASKAGVYYYRLVTPKRHLTKKMIRIRL